MAGYGSSREYEPTSLALQVPRSAALCQPELQGYILELGQLYHPIRNLSIISLTVGTRLTNFTMNYFGREIGTSAREI